MIFFRLKQGEIFLLISNMIKTHYAYIGGSIKIWGDIVNYVYHHNDNKVYI